MFTLERQNEIMELLKKTKTASVHELSQRFFTSEASIRRDLTRLEHRGLIKRTYGGAILIEGSNIEIPLDVRERNERNAKTEIAKMAASLIQNQDTIFLDSSSTTKQITHFLQDKNNLTVITNGIRIITELSEYDNVTVYGIGGKLRRHSLSMVGGQAESFVNNFLASKFFFSCTGLSLLQGAMDYSDSEAEVRKQIMKCCGQKILLADHSKFAQSAFYKICGFEMIDVLITDRQPPAEWEEYLNKCGVRLLCANAEP